jgi:hypothetical protein
MLACMIIPIRLRCIFKQVVLGKTYDTYLLSLKCFNLSDEAGKNYKLIITLFSDLFLCVISTSTDTNYVKLSGHNLKLLHVTMFIILAM